MTIKMENLRCEIVKLKRFSSSKSCLASSKLSFPSPIPCLLCKGSPIFSSLNPLSLASPPIYIYPPLSQPQKRSLFLCNAGTRPLIQPFFISIALTNSLPSLLPIPSGSPEQFTHQLFFLHLSFSLTAQEQLILKVARKIIIK